MQHRIPVHLPVPASPAQSSEKDQERPGPSHPSCSGLGQQGVVSGTSEHEHLSTDQATTLGGFSVAAAGQGPPPKFAQSTPSCVETEQWQLTAFDLPPEVVEVILAIRHPSTKSIYVGRWDKFVI